MSNPVAETRSSRRRQFSPKDERHGLGWRDVVDIFLDLAVFAPLYAISIIAMGVGVLAALGLLLNGESTMEWVVYPIVLAAVGSLVFYLIDFAPDSRLTSGRRFWIGLLVAVGYIVAGYFLLF